MTYVLFTVVFLCLPVIVIDLALIICWLLCTRRYHNKIESEPYVSILLAARNEEHNIIRCLESLVNLNYPEDKLQILIGDDASEDETFDLAKAFAAKYDHLTVYAITENMGNAKGKANVLAHLARRAKGDFYFITDADIAVPPGWIDGMLRAHAPNTGIVTGVTGVENNRIQHIDWMFALGMVKVITDMGQPVTAMGNNMYVTRNAYEAVGGYESIPFSITEDYELFRQVRNKGYKVVQLFNTEVLTSTRSIHRIMDLLHQRKRWMAGAIQLPWPIVGLLSFQALYYPSIIVLFFCDVKTAAGIWLLKLLIQSAFIAGLQRHLHQKVNWVSLIFYEVYAFFLSVISSIFFLIPVKITWKGRKY